VLVAILIVRIFIVGITKNRYRILTFLVLVNVVMNFFKFHKMWELFN
jgi:hypothetical protein